MLRLNCDFNIGLSRQTQFPLFRLYHFHSDLSSRSPCDNDDDTPQPFLILRFLGVNVDVVAEDVGSI